LEGRHVSQHSRAGFHLVPGVGPASGFARNHIVVLREFGRPRRRIFVVRATCTWRGCWRPWGTPSSATSTGPARRFSPVENLVAGETSPRQRPPGSAEHASELVRRSERRSLEARTAPGHHGPPSSVRVRPAHGVERARGGFGHRGQRVDSRLRSVHFHWKGPSMWFARRLAAGHGAFERSGATDEPQGWHAQSVRRLRPAVDLRVDCAVCRERIAHRSR